MKSTIKIDYSSSGDHGKPIIKIIRPQAVLDLKEYQDGDYDVRDKLINDFLHTPCKSEPNGLFIMDTCGHLELDNKFHITTIEALTIEKQFKVFRYNILNKLVPYNTLLKLNQNTNGGTNVFTTEETAKYEKVTHFFDWLDKQEWASHEEQHPYMYEDKQNNSPTDEITDPKLRKILSKK